MPRRGCVREVWRLNSRVRHASAGDRDVISLCVHADVWVAVGGMAVIATEVDESQITWRISGHAYLAGIVVVEL